MNYVTKNSKSNHEFLIFIGIVFPAFGAGCFGNELFFVHVTDFYIVYIGVFLFGFFEGFYVVLFTPMLIKKIKDIHDYSDETTGDFANGVYLMNYLIGFTVGPTLGSWLTL